MSLKKLSVVFCEEVRHAAQAVTAKLVPLKLVRGGGTNFGSKMVPPPRTGLIAKIGPTLPKTVHQSFSSTDKFNLGIIWMLYALGLFFCTVDGLTTVYFINNEVDLAVNEIMHQLQYHAG